MLENRMGNYHPNYARRYSKHKCKLTNFILVNLMTSHHSELIQEPFFSSPIFYLDVLMYLMYCIRNRMCLPLNPEYSKLYL